LPHTRKEADRYRNAELKLDQACKDVLERQKKRRHFCVADEGEAFQLGR
jgi:hypothetical protein